MEIVCPPRNERDRLDQTPHRGDDYMDDILPLLEENVRLGAHNRKLKIRTTFCRCLRRMPSFEGLLSHYRTSFSKASPIKSNATSLSAPMQSAADIGLRAAYHAHSEKPSPIFSTPAAAFCYGSLPESASKRTWPYGAHAFPLKDQEMCFRKDRLHQLIARYWCGAIDT
jgi:hypothetical protein